MKKLIALVLLFLLLAGCTSRSAAPVTQPVQPQAPAAGEQANLPQNPPAANSPEIKTVPATLYFPDSQALYLVRVKRDLTVKDGAMVKAIISELQKGNPAKVIPAEAKLLRAWVSDGIVHLDFSREFRDKHWGGSAGENMTIYSIVNSLTELPNIKGVQFYLEGKVEQSILGHADYRTPFTRNPSLIKQE